MYVYMKFKYFDAIKTQFMYAKFQSVQKYLVLVFKF